MWGKFIECTEEILRVGDHCRVCQKLSLVWGDFLSVQKKYSVWGIFLECTDEILSVGDHCRVCTEEILSVGGGGISSVYRRDPQCGGYF